MWNRDKLYGNLLSYGGQYGGFSLPVVFDDTWNDQGIMNKAYVEKSIGRDDDLSSTTKESDDSIRNLKMKRLCIYGYKPGCIRVRL